MVDVARFFMEFCMDESCGKCIPCRAGTVQLHRLLTRIGEGDATAGRPGPARGAVRHGQATPACAASARRRPNPVLSTLRYFRDEYEALLEASRRRRHGAVRCRAAWPEPHRGAVDMSVVKTLTIDGQADRARAEDQTHPRGGPRDRHRHPDAVPPRRPLRRRRLPALPGRGRRHPASCCRPASPRSPRAWRSAPTPSGCREYRRDDRRAALRRAQPRLLGLRGQRPLRAPGPGRRRRHGPRPASTTCTRRCAVDVSHERFGIDHNRCILCTRCVRVCDEIEGAHTWDVAGRGVDGPGHHRPEPALGRRRRPAPRAASACRPARPARSSARARPSPRWSTTAAILAFLVTRPGEEAMERLKLATVWLGGCSGCHMSFLDLDECLIDLAERVDLVYTPAGRREGVPRGRRRRAWSRGRSPTRSDLEMIQQVRARTKMLVSFGDCAVTGNVTAHAQPARAGRAGPPARLPRERRPATPQHPGEPGSCPCCWTGCLPVHAVVPVDCLPARLPAAGRPHPRTCSSSCSTGETPDLTGADDPVRLSRTRRATAMAQRDRHRPGDPDRGPRQDHHPPRRRRARSPTPASTSPSSAASRSSARAGRSARWPALTARICGICPVSHLLASAKAGDQILAVTHPAGRRASCAG